MVSLTRCLLALVCSASVATASMPSLLRSLQATRTRVVQRLAYRDIVARDPEPTTGSTCKCPDGTNCPFSGCLGSCPTTNLPAKRGLATIAARKEHFVDESEFDGTLLGPVDAARFLVNGGDFMHTNGTRVRDEEFLDKTIRLRIGATAAYHPSYIVGKHFVRLGTRFFAKALARLFGEGLATAQGRVLPFSDDTGVRVADIIHMIRMLLEDENISEVHYHHLTISRETLEELVVRMCPRLGEDVCGPASADIQFGPAGSD